MQGEKNLRKLAAQLGPEYSVTMIDFEPVLYRDFGNHFNAEISGMWSASKTKKATIYLWRGSSDLVKIAFKVPREEIGTVVDQMYLYTQRLISEGKDNSKYLLDVERRWTDKDVVGTGRAKRGGRTQ